MFGVALADGPRLGAQCSEPLRAEVPEGAGFDVVGPTPVVQQEVALRVAVLEGVFRSGLRLRVSGRSEPYPFKNRGKYSILGNPHG